ncbi:fungal-specific transcription factor domain-containing protein [Chaetomium sp. MPI-SDFR-AT-0129]|nr:fungal-specific transcription factor domain-containing protein [Chaetomium sp. MPI-SDFR-AT-0129]
MMVSRDTSPQTSSSELHDAPELSQPSSGLSQAPGSTFSPAPGFSSDSSSLLGSGPSSAFSPTQAFEQSSHSLSGHGPAPDHLRKPVRILACVLCQNRKIKCDRRFPCSNCTKSGTKCVPSTPAPARKRRRPNQDLQERLARCEEMIRMSIAEKEADKQRVGQPPSGEEQQWLPTGKLFNEDGNVRFIDSPVLGVIYDQLRTMRQMVADDSYSETSPGSMTPDDNSDMLLGGDVPTTNVADLRPAPAHAAALWQIYLDRVNPLTKIIHVPSVQPFIDEVTAGRAHNLAKNVEALLFSIYLMAVVSMTPDECKEGLGVAREEALQRFSTGVRLILLRIGFLRVQDMTTLRALVIYLISLQGRYDQHAVWVLNAIAVRIAQKMGLHRDGEALGVSPFECEMRRRLWWQIIMVDIKYAMFSGLSHGLLTTNWTTKSPSNINDEDIYPSMKTPVRDREGPTEMIFCLITYKLAKFMTDTPGFEVMVLIPEDDSTPGANSTITEEQQEKYRQGIARLREEMIEVFDKYCDPNAGPTHQIALNMKTHLVAKLEELMIPLKNQEEWGGEVKSNEDNMFKIAISQLEHNAVNYTSTMGKGFAWFSLLHFQVDMFMYVAGQLCTRSSGTLVERAWAQVAVVYTFHPELFDLTNKNFMAIAIYIIRAWETRQRLILENTGQSPEIPFYVEKLRACIADASDVTKPEPEELMAPNTYSLGFNSEGSLPLPLHPGDSLAQFLEYPLGGGGVAGMPGTTEWDILAAQGGQGPSVPLASLFGAQGMFPEW